MEFFIKRGDVFLADLNPVVGSEQGGIRPVIVLSNNIGNRQEKSTIIVACLTRRKKSDIPTHVSLPKRILGLKYRNTVLLEQIRTIDRARLIRKFKHGPRHRYMPLIDRALAISIGLHHKLREEFQ